MKQIFLTLAATGLLCGAANAQTANPFPTPPAPAAPRMVTLPTPTDTKLANGLRVIVVPTPGSGLVTMRLLIPSGSAGDGATGIAQTVAQLLTKGTKTRTATQIAEQIEQLGASLSAGAGYDSTSVTLSALKTGLYNVLPLFADVARNPVFPKTELDRYRAQTIDDLSVAYRQPGTLARLVAARVLFGDSGYAASPTGTAQTLAKVTQADVVAFYRTRYVPEKSVLVIAGDLTPAEARAAAQQFFGGWKAQTAPAKAAPTVLAPPEKRSIVVIDRPDAGQAAVVVNRFGTKQSEPTRIVADLANDILGGGYSSRLNREVRVKRGLSYGASSRLAVQAETGSLTLAAQTKNESAGETARVLVDELAKLATDAPAPDEFAARKSALSGDFARSLETGAGLAGYVSQLALYGRPLSELQSYLPDLEAATPEQVQTFARDRFGAGTANIVIVGKAAAFLTDLKARFPGETVTVIPFAKLDLNTSALTKGGK